jgi:hypothetical protein
LYFNEIQTLYTFTAEETMKTLICLLLLSTAAFAQNVHVKIIDRQSSETQYNYQIPGQSFSSANCRGNATSTGDTTASVNANCVQTASYTAPQGVSFSVSGATLALLLPDGRRAVVNCTSKFSERFAGREGNHRSCRVPIVDELDAEFSGKSAKLRWVASIDGKKTDSETYKILGILPKQ